MIDIGSGTPVVLIPGIQGRWEWMRRPSMRWRSVPRHHVLAVRRADQRRFRAIRRAASRTTSTSRAGDRSRAGCRAGVDPGVSYGGLIATEFAARHPERVPRLVLASALPHRLAAGRRARFYLRAPWLLSPLFVATRPGADAAGDQRRVAGLARAVALHRVAARASRRHGADVAARMARRVALGRSASASPIRRPVAARRRWSSPASRARPRRARRR